MKKVYSFCVITMLSLLAVNAQMIQQKPAPVLNPVPSSVIWFDDFSVASNWVIDHTAGTIGDWIISAGGPNGSYPISAINTTGDFAKFDSDSIQSHDQIANLTTAHRIDLTGHPAVRLTFSQYYRRFHDSTYVFISNDSINWTKFEVNTNLVDFDYSANDENINPDSINIDISSVAGNQDSVYVRFQFYSPDTNLAGADTLAGWAFAWMIDDVSISDLPSIDAYIDNIYAGEYCMISIIQALQLHGKLVNHGTSPITNGKILFNIYDQNGMVFADSSAVSASIAPGDTSGVLISLNPFVPQTTGSFLVEQIVSVPGDGDNTNDTNYVNIFVSDSTIARDLYAMGENTYVNGYGFAGQRGSMGSIFHIYNASSFSSATAYFRTPSAGTNISFSVYSVNNGVPDTLMGSSYIYTLTAADSELTLPFVPWVDVPAGDFFVCVNQLDPVSMDLGFSSEIFTPQKGFSKFDSLTSWTAFGPSNIPYVPILRVNNPSGTLLSASKVVNASPFNVYPNPTTGMIYVAGNGAEKNVTVTVLNSLGQIVKSSHFDTLTINRVDLHNLPSGMYTVNIKSSKEETNYKVIKL